MTEWIYAYVVPDERYALLRGNLGGWLRRNAIPAYRSNRHNGWWKRQDKLDDVLAAMQRDHMHVVVSTLPPPRHIPPPFLPIATDTERRSA